MSGSQSTDELVEELLDFCQSESLSEDGLRDIIERYDYDWNNIHVDRNYEFFLEACRNERVTAGILRCLLEYFPDAINSTDEEGFRERHGMTPLHIICFNRFATRGMVQLIVDASPESLSRVDNDGWMPLHTLCNKKELEDNAASDILGLLLERFPEAARHVTNRGYLPIHSAAISKSPEFCRMLIDAYPGSERMPLSTGALPLHLACISNTVATTEYLYKLYPECIGLTDSRTGRNGAYPIHYAIEGMKERANPATAVEIVQLLLRCDLNVTIQRLNGKLPLFRICYTVFSRELSLGPNASVLDAAMRMLQLLYDAHPEAIEDLQLLYDAHPETIGDDWLPQAMQTFINAQLAYFRAARDRTFISTPDENGQLPLHRALRDNITLGSTKLLIKGNPTAIQTPDNDGALPLHLAIQHHDSTKVVDYLVGLDPNTLTGVDREGNTALHHACCSAKYDTIALLMQKFHAVSVSKRNAYKKLPIHLLLESDAFVNREEDVKYTEIIFQLLRVYPETVMMAEGGK